MRARSVDEEHRASTPLELLFDLTFVVAVAAVAAELAHAVAEGHVADTLVGYLAVFFGIWWAWMNFTWFASAYDSDDVPYRLLTAVQMAGVLVLAAGVPAAFEHADFQVVTAGYVVMRLALVVQWLRAAAADPEHRAAAVRYAVGVSIVQVGWVLRLVLPATWAGLLHAVLVLAELAVPIWAERPGMTTWHPHHIAERYGLFTIIVLGECVLGASTAVVLQDRTSSDGAGLLALGCGGLALLFGLWWLYFLQPAADGLARRRELSFWWGYGHFAVFAAVAAAGAGLEVAAQVVVHEAEVGASTVGWAVAVPVAIVLVAMWALHAPLVGAAWTRGATVAGGAALVLVVPAVAERAGWGVPTVVVALAVVVSGVVALAELERRRPGARLRRPGPRRTAAAGPR